MKTIRNLTGQDIKLEYGGRDYRFDALTETEVADDVADVAQYRHAPDLQIVDFAHEAAEAAAKTAPPPEAPEPAAPLTFTCPHGDFATNDEAEYAVHQASAHGQSDAIRAAAAKVAEEAAQIPTDQTPAGESPSPEPAKES